MSKNRGVIDSKPHNRQVLDIRPSNRAALDLKPTMMGKFSFETEQLFQVVIKPGMPIGGLLLALTYTQGGTVMSPVTQ